MSKGRTVTPTVALSVCCCTLHVAGGGLKIEEDAGGSDREDMDWDGEGSAEEDGSSSGEGSDGDAREGQDKDEWGDDDEEQEERLVESREIGAGQDERTVARPKMTASRVSRQAKDTSKKKGWFVLSGARYGSGRVGSGMDAMQHGLGR
jgi:hypothetical protein